MGQEFLTLTSHIPVAEIPKCRNARTGATCPPSFFQSFWGFTFRNFVTPTHLSSVLLNPQYPKSQWTPRSPLHVLHKWMVQIVLGLRQ
jgi:hypothetical protein